MQGETLEEIADRCKPPKPSPEQVRDSILRAQAKFETACLKKVIANAHAGDVEAIDWLTKRGLFQSIRLPQDGDLNTFD